MFFLKKKRKNKGVRAGVKQLRRDSMIRKSANGGIRK